MGFTQGNLPAIFPFVAGLGLAAFNFAKTIADAADYYKGFESFIHTQFHKKSLNDPLVNFGLVFDLFILV